MNLGVKCSKHLTQEEAEAAKTERRFLENVSEVQTESYEEVPLAAPAPAQKLENRGTMDGLTSDQKTI